MADNENDENVETDETEKEVLISPVANILAFIGFTLLYLVMQMLMPNYLVYF